MLQFTLFNAERQTLLGGELQIVDCKLQICNSRVLGLGGVAPLR